MVKFERDETTPYWKKSYQKPWNQGCNVVVLCYIVDSV